MSLSSLARRVHQIEKKKKSKFKSIEECLGAVPDIETMNCGDLYIWVHKQGFTIEDINEFIRQELPES